MAKLCPALCDPMDSGPPASSVYGISQARILEWVAISFSRRWNPHLLHSVYMSIPISYSCISHRISFRLYGRAIFQVWIFPSTNNFTRTKEEAKEEHTKTQKQMSLQRQISYLAELPGESASSPLPAPSIKKGPDPLCIVR